MAEERDDADRTEEPSQRRLEQARERGQVAASREPGHFLLLGSGLLLVLWAGPWSAERLVHALRALLAAAAAPSSTGLTGSAELVSASGEASLILLAWLLALFLAALAGPFLQGAVVWSAHPLQPKLERISPIAGVKRLFALATLVEFAKGLLKLAIVAVVTLLVLRPLPLEVGRLVELDPAELTSRLVDLSARLVGWVLAIVAVLAAVDTLWQRLDHRRRLRMTRQELKEELRETEGDPVVKQRLRQLRLERARRRMMAEVPKATVVVTNPTHYAVALRYEAATMPAPKVVAKGVDSLALAIRDLARRHGVPVVENPPLARALHAALEPGDTIRPEHYKAVAELIAYVHRLGRPAPTTATSRA
ncbi:MAG: flagellar biosynthesis protein FlhB [Geminicoccaceae bacterium]